MIQRIQTETASSGLIGQKQAQKKDRSNKLDGKNSLEIEHGKLRVRIPVQNILFIRAEHVYCRIFFVNDQKILQRVSIENLLKRLPAGRFLRVHRSFVVNLCCVDRWSSTKVIVSGVTIPIGRTRRDEVVRRLKEMKG